MTNLDANQPQAQTQSNKSSWRQDLSIFGFGVVILILAFLWFATGDVIAQVGSYVIWVAGIIVIGAIVVIGIGFIVTQTDIFFVHHLEARKLRAQHRAQRDLVADEAEHRRRMMEAERLKALREAEVMTVVANNQVYISDTNPLGRWKHMHQMPHHESNGHSRPATPQEMETFKLIHGPRKALPGQSGVMEQSNALFPKSIPLVNLLPPEGASLEKLIFGLTTDEQGAQKVIKSALGNLVHVAVGGESGWGKSVFLLSLMFQVAYAKEDAEIVLIDPQATTFPSLAGSPKLRYQPADEPEDIIGIMNDLAGEFEHRKQLFKAIPPADKLSVYNRYANEPLAPIVIGIDEVTEVTSLLKRADLRISFSSLIQRCRKYGIYFVSGAPSWRASDLDSTVRSQFSTTVHFHARDTSSSRVLLGKSDAVSLTKKGHAFAILPGEVMTRMLSPYIDYEQVMRYLGQPVMPAGKTQQAPPPPRVSYKSKREAEDAEFKRLVESGLSRRKASEQAYGQQYGGSVVKRGKAALNQ